MHRETEMSYDEKIKMYLDHSKEDLAKMLVEANRSIDVLTNNTWFMGQYDHLGQIKYAFEKYFDKYLKLPKARITTHSKNEMYQKGWCVKTGGSSIIAPTPHRHFRFDEFVLHCQKDKEFRERFITDHAEIDGMWFKFDEPL